MPIDLKLAVFRLLMEAPVPAWRTRGRRGYFGRRRRYVKSDLETFMAKLPERPVILDLGANQGWFLKKTIYRAAEVWAVEPDPFAFARLREIAGDDSRVTLINAAVGAHTGKVSFFRPAGSDKNPELLSVSASVFEDHAGVEGGTRIVVEQIDICELLERIGKPVDMVKMDIEGAEVPVLERLFESGMIDRIGAMLVETHEHCLPSLTDRTFALRQRARRLVRPVIDFDWV